MMTAHCPMPISRPQKVPRAAKSFLSPSIRRAPTGAWEAAFAEDSSRDQSVVGKRSINKTLVPQHGHPPLRGAGNQYPSLQQRQRPRQRQAKDKKQRRWGGGEAKDVLPGDKGARAVVHRRPSPTAGHPTTPPPNPPPGTPPQRAAGQQWSSPSNPVHHART